MSWTSACISTHSSVLALGRSEREGGRLAQLAQSVTVLPKPDLAFRPIPDICNSVGYILLLQPDLCHLLAQLFFADDLAVEEVDFALGMFGKARIVRHHADGCTVRVQGLEE